MSYTPATELRRRFPRQEGNPRAPLRAADLVLPGVFLNTQQGRRYKAIVEDLVAEYGQTDITRLRELAALRVALEQTQGEVVGGSVKAREDMVRLCNLAARREAELRQRVASAAATRTATPLRQRLASMRQDKALGEAKASAGRGMAASRIERMGASRMKAAKAVGDDGGDG